jgi:hypothetical protein
MPVNTPVVLVTPLNVYASGDVPPDPLSVTVAVPPLQGTGVVTDDEPARTAGCVTDNVPVAGLQVLMSVMLHEYGPPAVMPVNTPVVLVTPLNVYDSGDVPPDPISVTVAVPPLQSIEVTVAVPVIAAGCVTVNVPAAGAQLYMSVMLQL